MYCLCVLGWIITYKYRLVLNHFRILKVMSFLVFLYFNHQPCTYPHGAAAVTSTIFHFNYYDLLFKPRGVIQSSTIFSPFCPGPTSVLRTHQQLYHHLCSSPVAVLQSGVNTLCFPRLTWLYFLYLLANVSS